MRQYARLCQSWPQQKRRAFLARRKDTARVARRGGRQQQRAFIPPVFASAVCLVWLALHLPSYHQDLHGPLPSPNIAVQSGI